MKDATRDPGLPLPARDGEEVAFERTIPADTHRFTTRTRERVRALDVLFEADARGMGLLDVLGERAMRTAAQTPLPERARELVRLVDRHADDVDEQLSTHSRDWPLHRMPAVDRAILRLGATELLHDAAAEERSAILAEYTKIAEALSTEDSPRFVNGLLRRLADVADLLG